MVKAAKAPTNPTVTKYSMNTAFFGAWCSSGLRCACELQKISEELLLQNRRVEFRRSIRPAGTESRPVARLRCINCIKVVIYNVENGLAAARTIGALMLLLGNPRSCVIPAEPDD
jgi:hypothetical protein